MARMIKVLLFVCVAAASVAVAAPKKNADVEKAVKAELLKKTFTTKILVGGYIPCPPNVNTSGHTDATKPVDTELSTNGSVRYFARANCFYSVPSGVIDLGFIIDPNRFYVTGDISGQIVPGTSVQVFKVDFKEDRVEVDLGGSIENHRLTGKIKYMIGAGYRTMSVDELMEAIAQGLLIPAYEKLAQVKVEFEALRGGLQEAENKYKAAGGTPDSKLSEAIALRQVLEQLMRNRAAFMALGKSDPEARVYSEKMNALLPEISRLTEETHKQRVAHIRDQLQAQLPQLTQLQAQVRQKPPSSLAEWQQRTDSLAAYSALLGIRKMLLDSLQSEKESPSPGDVKVISDGKVEIETVRKALELGHQQLELADLTSQYSQLTKKRAQLLDAYSRAFGTAKEKPALQSLVAVLGQMATNREQAATLGDKAAAAQLIKCRAEAEKYKRK